jgi:UDP-2,4-diacetamido-2,4,6-trideoxy-beta-L-altropyranose hydrolase
VRVLIRLDANAEIGMGHLVRSIAIAEKLRALYEDSNIIFLTGNDTLSINELTKHKFDFFLKVEESEESFIERAVHSFDAQVIFIDKLYPYKKEFIIKLKNRIKVIMFHNICEGGYFSDSFILPAPHVSNEIINDIKWKNGIVKFYEGFKYIVLNPDILKLNRKSTENKIFKIVITTGGSDPAGVMLKILKWINDFSNDYDIEILALIGAEFKDKENLNKIKNKLNRKITIKSFDVNEFISADLVISVFGVTVYELMFLGLPVITIGHCSKNALGSRGLARKYSATIDLGDINSFKKDFFFKKVSCLLIDSERLRQISRRAGMLIDGKGSLRVAQIIYQACK